MRVLIQRVSSAKVTIDEIVKSSIETGMLVFVGIEEADNSEDISWLSQKIINLRIFADAEGVMNLSVKEIDGEILIISQFTLHAATKKGNRPSYIKAAKPDIAIPLYESFVNQVETDLGKNVRTGKFGADMKVELVNDGPVTIWMDSKNKEY
jgi:D-tyrosyl-tRNA(Tyr) deacylase